MAPPSLDHIIILVPYELLKTPPRSLSDHFTIVPGGRHADGKTENTLVLFRDGSYLELIAFVDDDPAHREGHWWGDKHNGIIDFALTTADDAHANHRGILDRLGAGGPDDITYDPPKAGGRTRGDGVDVRWEITFPARCRRGELPFFCHDVTPRGVRVPLTESATTHRGAAQGAYGVDALVVQVAPERFAEVAAAYEAALGVGDSSKEQGVAVFNLGRVHEVGGVPGPVVTVKSDNDASGRLLVGLTIARKGDTTGKEMVQLDSEGLSLGGIFIRTVG